MQDISMIQILLPVRHYQSLTEIKRDTGLLVGLLYLIVNLL